MRGGYWGLGGVLVCAMSVLSVCAQSSTPPPSPFGSFEGNETIFTPLQVRDVDLPTFSGNFAPMFGITTTKSLFDMNGSSAMNVHMRTGVNIPLGKRTKVQIWYQREMGEMELFHTQIKSSEPLNPAQHYVIKLFYQF